MASLRVAGSAVSIGSLILDSAPTNGALAGVYFVVAAACAFRLFRYRCARRNEDKKLSGALGMPQAASGACCSHVSYSMLFVWVGLAGLMLRAISLLACCLLAVETTYRTSFTERLVAVLLGAGDWLAASAYLLLMAAVVYSGYEARQHLYSGSSMRRLLLVLLSLANVALVACAIGLYTACFATGASPQADLFRITFVTIACVNVILPGLLFAGWMATCLLFAGFPYRTSSLQRSARAIRRLTVVWTIARVLWATTSFVFSSQQLVNDLSGVGEWLFSLVLGAVFVLADLLPALLIFAPRMLPVLLRGPASTGSVAVLRADGMTDSQGDAPFTGRSDVDGGGSSDIGDSNSVGIPLISGEGSSVDRFGVGPGPGNLGINIAASMRRLVDGAAGSGGAAGNGGAAHSYGHSHGHSRDDFVTARGDMEGSYSLVGSAAGGGIGLGAGTSPSMAHASTHPQALAHAYSGSHGLVVGSLNAAAGGSSGSRRRAGTDHAHPPHSHSHGTAASGTAGAGGDDIPELF